jgi:hypothetical protein
MTAVDSDVRCARISLALDEPMAGTAPSSRRWLCVERPGGWPRDINQEREPALAALLSRAQASGFRPLLIRSDEPAVGGRPRRVFLTDTTPGRAVTTTVTVDDPDELNDLLLPDVDHPLPGEPMTEPLLLVCTHERDACCALDGAALLDAVSGPNIFACSHLGGHRFAPTALVLPTGYLYGRLDPISARAVLAAGAAGEVTTDRCRGRCTWSPEGQVADLAVRAATGLLSPDALVVLDDAGDTVLLATTSGQQHWAVDLQRVDVEAIRPASCGARPTLMTPLRATAVRALRPSS